VSEDTPPRADDDLAEVTRRLEQALDRLRAALRGGTLDVEEARRALEDAERELKAARRKLSRAKTKD
jgi:chromosome segregation ATPase